MTEFMTLMEAWEGYNVVPRTRLSEAALDRAARLLSNRDGMSIHRHRYLLSEAITTSDFPVLFGGILDRQVLALYQAAPSPWRAYVRTGTLPDFRASARHKVQGNQQLLARVREKEEYPISPMVEAAYTRQLQKRGRKFDISWEAVINDAFDAFSDLPQRFANAASYTEAFLATSIYAAAGGPNPALFGAPIVDVDGQNVTNAGVLPLTIGNLEITMQLMVQQTDVQGRPLGIRGAHLVVPPMLEFTALNILNSSSVQWIDDGSVILPQPVNNAVSQVGLKLHVDPLLPVIDGVSPNTTWYLFAEGDGDNTWGQLDFLRGHETPEICMKASNKLTLGGEAMDPMGGDFDTDDVLWRVRHCLGGSAQDPRYAYAQVG